MPRALLLAAALAGCTGDPPATPSDSAAPSDSGGVDTATPPCLRADPELDVGTGDSAFEPLSPGDPVVMVHGPQGGWHMLGSVRVRNTTDVVNIRFVIETLAGVVVADNDLNVLLVDEGECQGSYPGMYAYLDVRALEDGEADTPPELLSYETVLMTATITDQEGRAVTGSLEVEAVPDPDDVESGLAPGRGDR